MAEKTNWTEYYNTPYKTASITRKFTGQILVNTFKKHLKDKEKLSIIELGGANSAFLELIIDHLHPAQYLIIDNNQTGLDKTKTRIRDNDPVILSNRDILNLDIDQKADLVFSVGLIEHFDGPGTRKVIQSHFDLLKPGGIALITFPTPTLLYRIVRFMAELTGRWIFHDERPLLFKEVYKTAKIYGEKLSFKIIWPIMLTQGVAVFQKKKS
jgi:SAM-dependent methyltransferase